MQQGTSSTVLNGKTSRTSNKTKTKTFPVNHELRLANLFLVCQFAALDPGRHCINQINNNSSLVVDQGVVGLLVGRKKENYYYKLSHSKMDINLGFQKFYKSSNTIFAQF